MAREPDDDDVHVIDTVVEKSDRLAREYQKEREARARSKSVRRLDDDPRQKRRSQSSTRPRERSEKSRTAEREKKASGRERRAPGPDFEKLSEPFPPLAKKERESARSRPPTQEPKSRRQELPRSAPVVPEVTEPAHTSMDLLAMELEESIREARFGWRALRGADRLTLVCSVFMIAGVLMPWRSDPAHPMQIGLTGGGVLHLAIAIASFGLVVRSATQIGVRVRDDLLGYRRISLWLVLLGAASTVLGAFLLLLYGLEKAPDWPVTIHVGVYWTLVSGTGVSYGGYARFSDVRKQARQ